jgi:poly(beta-D-mannuronate) lyase
MTNSTTKLAIVAGIIASTFALSAQANYIQDSQLSEYRANKGESTIWVSHEDSDGGKGDVGSSGDTAFGGEGSSRFRFKESVASNDYTAKPGLSQVVSGLPANTDMQYSLYYCDKKGATSASTLYYGVREVVDGQPLAGTVIAESRAHEKDLAGAPVGEVKDCFKQVTLDFNSGSASSVEIFALMEINPSNGADMSKDAEVRIDEFSLTAK